MAENPPGNFVVRFPCGERIFSEGDIGTTMFVVQSGEVRLFRERDGADKTLATMEKGDFFGEMSVLEGLPRTNSAEAGEDCELIEINSMTFDRMIRGNIEIAVRMLRKLSIRLREADRSIEKLQRSSVPEPAFSMPEVASSPAVLPETVQVAVPPAASTPPIRRPAPSGPPASTLPPPPTPARVSPGERPAEVPKPLAAPFPAPGRAASPGAAREPVHDPRPARPPAVPAAAAAMGGARGVHAGPRLMSETGETMFSLSEAESLIGRFDPVTETQPEVDLTPIDLKRSVSRRHARITVSNGNYFLMEEVGAVNGTFLNGTRLVTGRPAELKDGDTLGMGTVRLLFRL